MIRKIIFTGQDKTTLGMERENLLKCPKENLTILIWTQSVQRKTKGERLLKKASDL
jgi:hypothetical protein